MMGYVGSVQCALSTVSIYENIIIKFAPKQHTYMETALTEYENYYHRIFTVQFVQHIDFFFLRFSCLLYDGCGISCGWTRNSTG